MFSWMEVLSQWKQGIVYPRWAALAHWGYGEARFLFYPPASWTLGAALGSFLPWKVVPGVYIWLVLWLAGLGMFRLARSWLNVRDALFAAGFYAVNPYHLVVVYWRSAYAELLASALLPLLLLWILRLNERGSRPILWLSLTLAAAWLINAPAAVMIHYSVAGLAALKAVVDRSWRPAIKVALAVALGAGLASFYLLPAAYEEKWVNIGEVLAPGVRPPDNFLFAKIEDADHNRFNSLVSVVAVIEIAAAGLAIWSSRAALRTQRSLWILLSAWAGISAVIMFAITDFLWEHLPKLRFVQLPWRWLLCLNAALAMLQAMGIRRWSFRVPAIALLFSAVIVAGHRVQPPWWDTAADIREMSNAMADGSGYEGTDEYVPAGADPYELSKNQPRVADSAGRPVPARVLEWSPEKKRFAVHGDGLDLVRLRLFNYPAWRVLVDGQPVETQTAEVTGQMMIRTTPGRKDIRIVFGRTPDRTIGGVVSAVSLGVLVIAWVLSRSGKAAETPA